MINLERFGFKLTDNIDPYYGKIIYRSKIINDNDLGMMIMDGYNTSYYVHIEQNDRVRIFKRQSGGYCGNFDEKEQIFFGYITTDEEMKTILKLLRITKEEKEE